MKPAEQEAQKSDARQPNAYKHQPPSLYVVPSFYEWLDEVSTDLGQATVRDVEVSAGFFSRVTQLLNVESRLLDQQAFDRWLELFVDECIYWIPSARPAPDPRTAVTLEFHDRRRLLDRIARLNTGLAYSQFPVSRTSRQWSGLEIWPSHVRKDEWHARYNFMLAESRSGHNRVLGGWNGFVLRETDSGLRLVVKQINLNDADGPQGNNSFFL